MLILVSLSRDSFVSITNIVTENYSIYLRLLLSSSKKHVVWATVVLVVWCIQVCFVSEMPLFRVAFVQISDFRILKIKFLQFYLFLICFRMFSPKFKCFFFSYFIYLFFSCWGIVAELHDTCIPVEIQFFIAITNWLLTFK